MPTILVCDDEKDIVKAIEIYLKMEKYTVLKSYNGQEALDILKSAEVDLLIADVMMPVMDGIELIEKTRKISNIPIIILSAKGELTDKVHGLNVGADDYITKPFDAVELLARVKSSLRRSNILVSNQEKNHNIFMAGRVSVNDSKKEVLVDGEVVKLTPYEYGILLLLIQNVGCVFSSDEIYEKVWDSPPYDVKKIVSVHISRLRDKLEINPRKPDMIKSVYGMGYKIEE